MYSLTTTSSLSWIVVIIGLGNFLFVERSRLASTCRRYVNLAFQKLFSYTTTNPITLNNRWDVCSKSDLFIFFMKETLLLLLAIPSVQALGSLLNRIVVSRDQKCWNNTTPAAVTHGRTPSSPPAPAGSGGGGASHRRWDPRWARGAPRTHWVEQVNRNISI